MSDPTTKDSSDPRKRFSSRVEAYAKYRPGYPPEVIDLLRRELGFGSGKVVADIGSGTGIFSEMLLKGGGDGALVLGVEPNAAMREFAETNLSKYPGFRSVDGSGEQTNLPDRSVDLVTCAQAFHWLDRGKSAAEFKRICKPGGGVAILWNARKTDSSPFLAAYDELLLRWGTDYAKVAHEKVATTVDDLTRFFGVPFRRVTFPNEQRFDLEGLRGRVASASYTPMPGERGHAELFDGLDELFDRHATGGRVVFEYETEVFSGRLPAS